MSIINRVYLTTIKQECAHADTFYPELEEPTPDERGWELTETVVDNDTLKIEIYDLTYANPPPDIWEQFRC